MTDIMVLQELMVEGNLVIRALPKEVEGEKDSFIVGVKEGTDLTVDSWEWLYENNELMIFNSLEEIVEYFE